MRADTLDFYVMNTILTYQHKMREIERNGGRPPIPELSQDKMLELLKQSRK